MECGECNFCCEALFVKELKKEAFKLCDHYCKGCSIYDKRPEECKNFECTYYQALKANIAVRPDNCGVMFEMVSDNIFLGILHPNRELSDIANGQIDVFVKGGYSVVLSKKDEKLKFYISDKHDNEEIFNEFKSLIENKNGSTSIRN